MIALNRVYFSVAIRLCDVEMQLSSTSMNSRVQGHLVTLDKGHLGLIS